MLGVAFGLLINFLFDELKDQQMSLILKNSRERFVIIHSIPPATKYTIWLTDCKAIIWAGMPDSYFHFLAKLHGIGIVS